MEPLRTSLSIIMPVFNHRDEVRERKEDAAELATLYCALLGVEV